VKTTYRKDASKEKLGRLRRQREALRMDQVRHDEAVGGDHKAEESQEDVDEGELGRWSWWGAGRR
jgi:hypothetical protein